MSVVYLVCRSVGMFAGLAVVCLPAGLDISCRMLQRLADDAFVMIHRSSTDHHRFALHDLYGLHDPYDLYDLAHVIGWDPAPICGTPYQSCGLNTLEAFFLNPPPLAHLFVSVARLPVPAVSNLAVPLRLHRCALSQPLSQR